MSYNIKRIFISLIFITLQLGMCSAQEDIERMLQHLDSLIASEEEFTIAKEERIALIRKEESKNKTPEEMYWFNNRMYNEYYVFDADSALSYVNKNLAIARAENNVNWENKCKINKSFILSVMGLVKDASDELASIDPKNLSGPVLADYYGQLAFLCSHMSQLSEHRSAGADDYDEMAHIYQDSASIHIPKDSPDYLTHKGSALYDNPQYADTVLRLLEEEVRKSDLDSRQDAINCYVISRLYGDKGDEDNRIRYLIKSGSIDVKTANRDIASLEELSAILLERGDIERAYAYINYCRRQALDLPNRVRAASLTKAEADIHQKYVDKMRHTSDKLRIISTILMIVSVLLIFMVLAVINRSNRVRKSRKELSNINATLSEKLRELSEAQKNQAETLVSLKKALKDNEDINSALEEANYVKEECIGATFALCSSYIDRLDQFRIHVSRLVKSNSWKVLRDEVTDLATTEYIKEFYRNFDTIFLNIYPDFVQNFNGLLKEEERISVKPGELNTELRIYALVRLGINDSVKIASLLHCSPQTVYNYRLRTRNKAVVPKEDFVEIVKTLGIHNQEKH